MALDIFKSYNKQIALQLQAEAEVAAARQDKADSIVRAQIADIRATLPSALPPALAAALPPSTVAASGSTQFPTSYLVLAGVGAAALLLILGMRR